MGIIIERRLSFIKITFHVAVLKIFCSNILSSPPLTDRLNVFFETRKLRQKLFCLLSDKRISWQDWENNPCHQLLLSLKQRCSPDSSKIFFSEDFLPVIPAVDSIPLNLHPALSHGPRLHSRLHRFPSLPSRLFSDLFRSESLPETQGCCVHSAKASKVAGKEK